MEQDEEHKSVEQSISFAVHTDESQNAKKKETFFDRHPRLKKIAVFCAHPTIWRFIAIGIAVFSVVATGGATIPLIGLVATAFTSLIGVVSKVIQHRAFERIKLQNGLTKVIEKREQDIHRLRQKNPRVFEVLAKKSKSFAESRELHAIKNIEPESRIKSAIKIWASVGLEKFWSVAMFTKLADPIGVTTYVAGIIIGTIVVKSEYQYRVLEAQEKSKLKKEINARCKMLGITKYGSEKELYIQFQDRMINYKAVELLCKEDTSKKTEDEILEKFDEIRGNVAKEMQFHNIPKEISTVRNVWNAINPLKQENDVRVFNIDFDEKKLCYEMRSGYEGLAEHAPSQAQSKEKGGDQELYGSHLVNEVRQKLQKAKASSDDVQHSTSSVEDVRAKLQGANASQTKKPVGTIKEAQERLKGAVKQGFVDEEDSRREKKSPPKRNVGK